MDFFSGNPSTNKLSLGVNEEDVLKAIANSGYPLQNIISEQLKEFKVTEEWSFVDRDTLDLRNIDILAELDLYNHNDYPDTKVRPGLSLLIECKQTSLPYVFFATNNIPYMPHFPMYSGLRENDYIDIKSDNTRDTWSFSINHIFNLQQHEFVSNAPLYSKVFSKCVRKGKEIELSGSDTYNSVILPLTKALAHYSNVVVPPKTAQYFDCYMTLGVAIIDGPMIGVKVKEEVNNINYVPWVRVLRHEHEEGESNYIKGKHYVIDVVHKDFFNTYIDQHLIPFANNFGKLALKHARVLASGKGTIKGMAKNPWSDLEQRLL
ncbi:hypothetical protein [Brevibacillus reuszeri]|uniref:hypothetical protein n=1 Tax=Brevibacillus reuszeri TaxID=54915 RepID=UPI000CCC7E0C|nr:hypothetical protein [Brevibacillus reuszeri]